MRGNSRKKLLAISSSGGHWVQLMRLRPAWDDCDTVYMTTEASYRNNVEAYARDKGLAVPGFYTTVVATRWQKLKLIRQLMDIVLVLVKERPDVIISTGAAAGFFALRIGKLLGAKTIWVDSIANVYDMSLSGQKAVSCADAWLTQWPHLAAPDQEEDHLEKAKSGIKKPEYWGEVI